MSDVVVSLRMTLKCASLVVHLATLIPVLLGAPITSLPEVLHQSNPLDIATVPPKCQNDFYFDNEIEDCLRCVFCPVGMGSTASTCGDGYGEKGVCEDCIDGETFQDQTATKGQCNTCRMCDSNASVLNNCTKHSDTQCGPCNEGYGQHPNIPGLCSLCKHLNDDEKPPECLMATPTPTPPVIAPDTDECMMNQNTCDTSVSTCHNTIGSYRCECLSGYVKNSLDKCVDINECESPDSCNDSISRCNNTNGSYTCDCLTGFEIDSSNQCVDINECDLQDSCDASISRCSNTNGSYTCDCLPGFEMDSMNQCVDVNECELHLDSCDASVSRCSNINGSYTCDCLRGFEMDSSSQCIGNSSTGTNIVAIVVTLGILGPVLILLVLAVIWLWRKRCKDAKVSATQMTTLTASQDEGQMQESDLAQSTDDSGRRDDTASATSDSPQAVTNSNRQSLPPASQEELESLLGGETSLSEEVVEPNAGTDVNDDRALTGAQGHDSPTANGNIFNHTPEDDSGEVVEPNTDTDVNDDRALTGAQGHDPPTAIGNIFNHTPEDDSGEVVEPNAGTDVNDDRALTGAQGHDSPTANGNIFNHAPEDDSGEVVEPNADTDVNDDRALTGAQGHDSPTANGNIFNHTPEDDSGEVVEPNTDTDVKPFSLSTESASSDETRDDLGPLEKISGEGRSTTVRPCFNRSQSVPAKTSNENAKGEDKTFPILPENTQKSLVETKYKDRTDNFKKDFQKALVLGEACRWKDFNLLFRTRVNKMMKTESKEKDFKAFGELMGLKCDTDLKDCSDLNSVFTQLEMSLHTEVFMDKALLTLSKMKRNDIVREIVKELIDKKPTCRGD